MDVGQGKGDRREKGELEKFSLLESRCTRTRGSGVFLTHAWRKAHSESAQGNKNNKGTPKIRQATIYRTIKRLNEILGTCCRRSLLHSSSTPLTGIQSCHECRSSSFQAGVKQSNVGGCLKKSQCPGNLQPHRKSGDSMLTFFIDPSSFTDDG